MAIHNPKGPHHLEHETGGSDALATLDGGIILTGTIPDARHSANIPRLNASNVFTATINEMTAALNLRQPAVPVNQRLWQFFVAADTSLYLQALNDAGTVPDVQFPLILTRGGALKVFSDVTEKNRTAPMGHWIDIAFNAGNFTTFGGGSWTVPSHGTFAYMLIGKTLWLTLQILTSTVTGTPSALSVALPAGFTAARATTSNVLITLASLPENGIAITSGGVIVVYRSTMGAWAAGTVRVDFTIPVSIT